MEPNITLDTWIIADTHFGHDNIIRYCNRPSNHEQVIVQNWNALVAQNEDVLHLGDLIFNNTKGSVYARQLKGRKFLLRGNHDSGSVNWFADRGFVKLPYRKILWTYEDKTVLFSHEPAGIGIPWDINIHGHIHNHGWDPIIDSTRDYRNVSIEVMGYKPVRLREILEGDRYESIASPLSLQKSA